ncbi:phage head spike fiber domain-containing protein [Aeromonas dhakensis]|uniref:phage head spike fiber domain-containing protein n=1 Tax=Aeromonas dhakensis TaxID=196024 RepID=UPI003BA3688C
MAGLWQRTGNVTVTNGSKTITGFGTKWKTGTLPIQKGHTFYGPDNAAYEVDTVVSDESILLVDTYRGGTLANQAYRIDITRTSTISQFAADLASLVAKYRSWFDGMMTWLTGSGDVAILNPDTGANVTIPSWKKVASEGEGQTARAKVEADRAKTEADRALTEADRAAGIVAAAALPLPDVWAPLSDSLRLITGYGRDVLVGSDVVARMVNFSRNSTATYIGKDGLLKTAAANEPRFEKDGLLVEGQSTNLLIWSDDMSKLIQVNTSVSEGVITGAGAAGVQTRIEYGGVIPVGVSGYTITVEYDPSQSMGICQLRVGGDESGWVEGSTPVTLEDSSRKMVRTITPDGWVRVSVTSKVASSSSAIRINFAAKGAASAAVSTVGLTAKVRRVQVEALPFASSYIPTNGAAVTRAKDILYLAPSGNVPSDINMTFAAQIKLMGKGLNSWPRVFEISDTANKGAFVDIPTGMWGGVDIVGVRKTVAARFSDTSRWLDGVKVGAAWQPYPVKTYSDPVYIAGSNVSVARDFYGHVRNVRAWFFSPTDDQMKAIR